MSLEAVHHHPVLYSSGEYILISETGILGSSSVWVFPQYLTLIYAKFTCRISNVDQFPNPLSPSLIKGSGTLSPYYYEIFWTIVSVSRTKESSTRASSVLEIWGMKVNTAVLMYIEL